MASAQDSAGGFFGGNDYFNGIDFFIPGYTMLNNAFDFTGQKAAQAQYQNQLALDQSARQFSANEAAKQRAWEEYMSSTAIQRQMADLKAAGLNPWLSLQGNFSGGASTPTGSSAQSNSGQANMANNKLAMAAGLIATALRMFLAKH